MGKSCKKNEIKKTHTDNYHTNHSIMSAVKNLEKL